MPAVTTLERLLKRDGAITAVGLVALCVLAWLYLMAGAGLGVSAWEMTTLLLSARPHPVGDLPPAMAGMDMEAAAWHPTDWVLMIGMWWVMMIAMMTPSAAPAILLYARVHRHALESGDPRHAHASTGLVAAGYLLMWLAFSLAAASLHRALEQAGILSAMTMGLQVRWVSGALLVIAGLYQLSPWKSACLSQCRAPASFIAHHWRPHALGALRLGALHGAYCIGCCWMLMALLFVGGVMNLAWIAALSLLILAEKVLALGRWVGRGAGWLLIAWGLALLLLR